MTINNAIKRLLDSEQELSYSQRIAIVDLIESLKFCGNCKFSNKPEDKNNGGCFACKDTRGENILYHGWQLIK